MNTDDPPQPRRASDKRSEAAAAPVVDARDLLGEGREVVIVHKGERYRLHITAKDKLILTK